MIIRRFVTALRKQDWTTVTIEFLIVVAGIFVGLQVDDWNKARAAAEIKREMLALIVSDMNREADALDRYIERFSDAQRGVQKVAAIIQSHPNVNPEEMSSAVKMSLSGWIWVPYDSVYRNLQQSGDFSIIGNKEITFRLVEHYQSYGGSFEFMVTNVFEARAGYEKAIYTTMVQYPIQSKDGLAAFSLPNIYDIEALRDDGAFWASLRVYLNTVERSIKAASVRRDRAKESISLIEEFLSLQD